MTPTEATGHMTTATAPDAASAKFFIERRFEMREPVTCDLWMIDHHGSTVLRCHCLESSVHGMRLRVPLGYGVAEGQRYELRSHLPGSRTGTTLGLVNSRWATVIRTHLHIEDGEDHLDVGVVLDTREDEPLPRGSC